MAVRPRGGQWQVDVQVQGVRWRGSAPNQAEAKALEAEARASLLRGRSLVVEGNRPRPADQLIDLEQDTLSLWDGQAVYRTAAPALRQVIQALGPTTRVSDVTSWRVMGLVKQWQKAGNKGSTINRKLDALRKLLGVAAERGLIPDLPKIDRLTEPRHRLRWLTEEEEEALLEFASGDFRALCILALDTGARPSELRAAALRDVEGGKLHLWRTKNGYPRTIPLTPRAREVFVTRKGLEPTDRPFRQFTASRIYREWKAFREHMGLQDDPEFVFYSLRHTCASRLVQRGIQLQIVKEWMGHKNIQMTLRYAHLSPEALLSARDALICDKERLQNGTSVVFGTQTQAYQLGSKDTSVLHSRPKVASMT